MKPPSFCFRAPLGGLPDMPHSAVLNFNRNLIEGLTEGLTHATPTDKLAAALSGSVLIPKPSTALLQAYT